MSDNKELINAEKSITYKRELNTILRFISQRISKIENSLEQHEDDRITLDSRDVHYKENALMELDRIYNQVYNLKRK